MTKEEVIALINSRIVENHSEAITADVLNPILISMVEQINDLVGDRSNLEEADVISEVNKVEQNMPEGLTILSGENNPNENPPPDFSIGDFYTQTDGSKVYNFWQYNGNEWAEVLGRNKIRTNNIRVVSGDYAPQKKDDVIIFNNMTNSAVVIMDISDQLPRRIINLSDFPIETDIPFLSLSGLNETIIEAKSMILLQSTGTRLQQLNNL